MGIRARQEVAKESTARIPQVGQARERLQKEEKTKAKLLLRENV